MVRVFAALKQVEPTLRRSLLIALLYLILPFDSLFPIEDPDIWWHLRTGEWITHAHRLPMFDSFSGTRAGQPWIAYSWAFDVLVYALKTGFDLRGLVWLVVLMALLITFGAHQLARTSGLPFYLEIVLTALAVTAMKTLMSPRSWLFSIVFFAIEFAIIVRVRSSNRTKLLWVLPILFFVWANIHIQFLYGLAALMLLLIESLAVPYAAIVFNIRPTQIRPQQLFIVLLSCLLATFLTPYTYHLYRPVIEIVEQTGVFQNVNELLPMAFRSPDNWIVLFFALATAFGLGSRRQFEIFPMLMLLLGAFFAFRARRDVWFLLLTAVWILTQRIGENWPQQALRITPAHVLVSGMLVVIGLAILNVRRQINEPHLMSQVEKSYPVKAVEFVKANRLPGPLFNDYDWGGFLIWSLPELPVTIDGRSNLYGDQAVERSIKTWGGHAGWDSDPNLLRANVIIAETDRALTSLLRLSPNYKLLYEDKTAAVIVPVERK